MIDPSVQSIALAGIHSLLSGGVLTDNGAGTRTRTADLRFTKPLLYHLSYAGLEDEILFKGVAF